MIDATNKHATGTGVFTKCIYKSSSAGTCSAASTCTEIPSASS